MLKVLIYKYKEAGFRLGEIAAGSDALHSHDLTMEDAALGVTDQEWKANWMSTSEVEV